MPKVPIKLRYKRRAKTRIGLRFKKRPVIKLRYKSRFRPTRVLGNGVQWHKTTYALDYTMNTSFVPRVSYEEIVRDIPKYRNDPTATNRQANLAQARVRDRIFVKGAKFRIASTSTETADWMNLRWIFFRNNAWDEAIDAAGTNWIKNVDGSNGTPSTEYRYHSIERFNTDLVKNKRRDILFDRQYKLPPVTASNPGIMTRREFYVPINQIACFESKGDSSSADDLSTGRYWFIGSISNHDNSGSGDVKTYVNVELIWCEN